ncbi:MAG: penicillin-binding protein [Myxococcales bacterium]|nr:MAG: penicillin-binding protein [Myxococcales bacterium]
MVYRCFSLHRVLFFARLVLLLFSGSSLAVASPEVVRSEHGMQMQVDLNNVDVEPSAFLYEEHAVVVPKQDRALVLSLHPGLQQHLSALLERNEVPAAGVVVMEAKTGRVLAYVSHQSDAKQSNVERAQSVDWAREAKAPAASVFKIVTAAALLDSGITASKKTCYSGGRSSLVASNLLDNPAHDTSCASFAQALGYSINSVFAKLAVQNLKPQTLERYASAFGFGHALPFDLPTSISAVDIPQDDLEFARMAAGFRHSTLSPLHGALLASTIANQGVMPRPYMIQSVRYPCGEIEVAHDSSPFRSVIPSSTARVLGSMMERTVSSGTSYKSFHDKDGKAYLPGVSVAAKTGSLSDSNPFRAYSWWVGYAPAQNPKFAVGVLVVNHPSWRIKAPYVAKEALRYGLYEMKSQKATPSQERACRQGSHDSFSG